MKKYKVTIEVIVSANDRNTLKDLTVVRIQKDKKGKEVISMKDIEYPNNWLSIYEYF